MATTRRRTAVHGTLERMARHVTAWAGSSSAFAVALGIIGLWALTGPLFHYSDTWQLVINTGTTIVTFLMVFLIQRSQNKDAQAIHLKLNEIVAALAGASNRLINIEDLTEEEVRALHGHYQRLVTIAKRDDSLTRSHSVEEADTRYRAKKRRERIMTAVAPSEVAATATAPPAPEPPAPIVSTEP